ncbi:MAG: endonuclease III, partial [Gammaproteobacteria bacterium]|nr:endonuclease III [Gammaproteobacteria bacterium]
LIEKYRSHVPTSREALEALPGVGRKTANVILNTAFGQPTIAVDTHVFRVANRTGIALGKKCPRRRKKNYFRSFQKKFIKDAHHWLILHGRYICTARAPKCEGCGISHYCRYKHT